MPSIFDFLFGGQQAANPAGGAAPPFNPNGQQRAPSILDSPEYGNQRMNDALAGMAQALIQAGGPSAQPRGFLDAFGAAGAGALVGQQGSEDKFLKRAMVNSQVRKNESDLARAKAMSDFWSGGGQAPESTTQTAPPGGPTSEATAIGKIEGDYTSVGPAADAKGSRGYGKFQVMDYNVGPWTKELLGREMTPQEFLANPQAQDAVFNGKFAQYKKMFGGDEVKAAKAWFAGPGGVNNPNARDVNGMTVQRYGDKYAANRGLPPVGPGGAGPTLAALPAFEGPGTGAIQPGALPPGVAPGVNLPPPAPQGVQVAQGGGDASGNPVQSAQYQPPQFKTAAQIRDSIPPGVRQFMATATPEQQFQTLMKYADPGSAPALDTQTGQVVFVPNTVIGRDPRYQPVQGAELDIKRRTLANSERKTDIDERNADVTIGNDGKPVVNQTVVDAKKAVSAAQGTDPSSKITFELAQDAIKRNGEWQNSAMKAQSSIGRLNALQGLLDQITTGKFAGTVNEIKATAKAAGIDLEAMGITDKVGVTQAAQALTNLMALENRDPSTGAGMPGAMSDADRNYLQQASVSITKDAAGNKILIATKKSDMQRQIDVAKYAREYMQSPQFKQNPAGLEDYVSGKIAGKDYYDQSVLPQQSIAPPGAIPQPAPAVRKYNSATGKIE